MSGKLYMLRRFINIREELLEIHDSRDGHTEIDDTTRFQGKVIKYTKMLRTIDIVTKSLQNKYHTLSECRDDLDVSWKLSMKRSTMHHRIYINAG